MTRLALLLALAAAPGLAQDKIVPIEQEPGHVLERVRVTRLMLGPGESISLHPSYGVLVAVSKAQVRVRSGGPEETLAMAPADFNWRDSFAPVLLVNTGSSVFHAVK